MNPFSDYFENHPTAAAPTPVAPEDEGLGETFSKGLSSGIRNAGASLNQLAGLSGEAVGANGFARNRYAAAQTLRQSAAEMAPRNNTWDDVRDTKSLLRFGAGELGAMAPVAGAAVGAGLVTGNPFTAGSVAMGVPAAGDIATRQQEDPQAAVLPAPTRLRNALLGGAAVGVASNLGPGMFANKLAGAASAPVGRSILGTIGHNMAESVGVNAAGSAAGEGISQYATNQDAPLDTKRIQDAAVAGGVMGLPFGAGGAAADLVRSRVGGAANAVSGAAQSVRDRISGGNDASAADAPPVEPTKVASMWDNLGGLVQKGREKIDDTVDRVAAGQPLGDLQEFASATGDRLRSLVDTSNNETLAKAKQWGTQIAEDAGLTPERRQAAADALQNLSEQGGASAMAAMKKTYDAGKVAADKIGAFAQTVGVGLEYGAEQAKDTINQRAASKRSDDDSGFRQVFRDSIIPAVTPILKDVPGMFDRPADVQRMGDALRAVGERMGNGPLDSDTVAKAIDAFGDKAVDVLSAVHGVMGKLTDGMGQAQTESFFKNLSEIDAIQKRTSSLHDTVASALTDDAKQSMLSSDIPDLTRLMVAHARGEFAAQGGERSAKETLTNTRMADLMEEHFGPKADFVSKAVEKEAGQMRGTEVGADRIDEAGNVMQASAGGFDENSQRVSPQAMDTIRKGRGPRNEPVMDPELFKHRDEPGQNYAAQYMKDMQAKYPDHNVRFEKVDGSDTHGHVVAEKAADPGSFNTSDLESLKHDTHSFPNSPSRLKVGDMNIDAVKVAKVMRSKGQADWEGPNPTTNKERLVDAFKRGIAQLSDQAGEAIHVPDGAVIGFTSGHALTWGEAKNMVVRRSAQDRASDADTQMVHEYRKQIAQATFSDEKLRAHNLERVEMSRDAQVEMQKARKALEKKIEDARDAHLAREPNDGLTSNFDEEGRLTPHALQDDLQARGITERSKDEQIHQAAIGAGVNREPVKSNMAGGAHSVSDRVSEPRNELAMTVQGWGRVEASPARKIAERAKVLLASYDSMGKADRRAFQLLAGKSPAEASGKINELARKYKDVIVAPKSEARGEERSADGGTTNTVAPTRPRVVDRSESPVRAVAREGPAPLGKDLEDAVGRSAERMRATPRADSTRAAKPSVDDAITSEKYPQTSKGVDRFLQAASDRYAELHRMLTGDHNEEHTLSPKELDAYSRLAKLFGRGAKEDLAGFYDGVPGGEGRTDESIRAALGSTPNPKALAAKKAAFLERAASGDEALTKELQASTDAKGLQRAAEALPPGKASDTVNTRLAELVQDPSTAYGLETKKYSLESTDHQGAEDGRARLITRLAADRRDVFAHASKTEVVGGKFGANTFGPLGREYTHYFANEAGTTHGFIVPDELVPRLSRELSRRTAAGDVEGQMKALAFFSVQHGFYDSKSGSFETFGPRTKSPGGEILARLGALGDTGKRFADGEAVTRVEGVTGRETANFLASVLAYSKHVLGKDMLDVNWERVTGASDGKEGGGKYSSEPATGPDNTPSRANVEAHIEKVLGKSVKVAWAKLTHAGEFERMRTSDVIRLSVHALDPMSVAHHESVHAFFAKLRDAGATDITKVLEKAAESPHALAQMQEFFKNEPAVLAQLKDPEERAAYMYQLWASNPKSIQLGPQVKGVFGKIGDFIRSALGIWSNDQRALHIMEFFHSGEFAKNLSAPSVVRDHLMRTGRSEVLDAARSFTDPLARVADAVFGTGGARVRDTGIPSLNNLADLIKRDYTKEGGDQGFIPAARIEATKRRGALGDALADYTPEQLQEAMEGLQKAQKPASQEAQAAAAAIKGVLAKTKAYMEKAGVELGDLGPDYFPRVWDTHYISKHPQEFMDMLEPYVRSGQFKGDAREFMSRLSSRDGAEFGIETRTPGMQFKKERSLAFIKPEDAAQFVSKDLYGTLNSYINQATRRAEWNRRLGDGQLESLIERAKAEGATKDDLALADQYLKGVDGTLGDNLNPHARRIMGNMIVYQNVRLLPMAMFSMLIDPMGVMVRGGTLGEAWSTFKRGMAEIPESFGRAAKHDEASRMAELVGVVDSAALAATMGDVYTQSMVGGTAQKINNTFFKANMVEGLNRSFRIGASEAAMSFMGRHADGTNSVHSKRWMAELGLQKGDIKTTPGGRIALTEAEGLSPEQVTRVHGAVNQWVDGAMLRPDAADKPIWMNDPHYALVSHLKQFVFAFQKVIIGRVTHELQHGNYAPAMALASYVPIMMAADFAKGLIMGGGDQPEWKKGWGMGDYIGSGVQRAGLLGVGQFGFDVAQDLHRGGVGLGAVAGPTLEQFADSVQLLGGHKQFGSFVLDAMPANALYKESLGGESKADPMFPD